MKNRDLFFYTHKKNPHFILTSFLQHLNAGCFFIKNKNILDKNCRNISSTAGKLSVISDRKSCQWQGKC